MGMVPIGANPAAARVHARRPVEDSNLEPVS
jgi:hypothetical protein